MSESVLIFELQNLNVPIIYVNNVQHVLSACACVCECVCVSFCRGKGGGLGNMSSKKPDSSSQLPDQTMLWNP